MLWLRAAENPQRARHGAGGVEPGSINVVTRKRYLPPGYGAATINHALSVLGRFYETPPRYR